MELEVAGWKEVGQPILLGTWGTEKHQLISGNNKKKNEPRFPEGTEREK